MSVHISKVVSLTWRRMGDLGQMWAGGVFLLIVLSPVPALVAPVPNQGLGFAQMVSSCHQYDTLGQV